MKNNIWSKFTSFCKRLFKKADSIVFPSRIKCLGCGTDLPKEQDIEFCDKCLKQIEKIPNDKCCKLCGTSLKAPNICPHCKENKRDFDIARSVCKYNDFMASLIAKYKYHNHPYMSFTFGNMLTEKFKKLNWNVDFVVPVPITKKRQKQRGFNQAKLIADVCSKNTNIAVLDNVLIKQTETSHQADLDYEERQQNILGTFKVADKKQIAGKNILVIDDVLTTGATTSACAKALKKSKANQVFVLAVASTSYFDKEAKKPKNVVKVAKYVKSTEETK